MANAHESGSPPPRAVVPAKRRAAVGGAVIVIAIGTLAWALWRQAGLTADGRATAHGKDLLPIDVAIPDGRAGWVIRFDRETLREHRLCLCRGHEATAEVAVDREGRITRAGKLVARIEDRGELLVTPSGTTLFADDMPVPVDLSGCDVFWATDAGVALPPRAALVIPRLEVRDDFMRARIEEHPYSRITNGTVRLARHGGGMATTDDEEADPSFQRAVNPFSVHASRSARLTYRVPGADRWGDTHVEARFYFGVPKTGNVVDTRTVPADTDMLVVQGAEGGYRVAFGWSGRHGTFVLEARDGDGSGEVIGRWQGSRPPLTNWVKVGLTVRRGHVAEAFLDDVRVLRAELGRRVRGPFHIESGSGLIEYDDVRAWSLPAADSAFPALCVKSRQFAGKRHKANADRQQFDQWAASDHVFRRVRWRDLSTGCEKTAIVTAEPLMGDIVYEAIAVPPIASPIPEGRYEFAIFASRGGTPPDVAADTPSFSVAFERVNGQWLLPGRSPRGDDHERTSNADWVRFGRMEAHASRVCLWGADGWEPVSEPVPGPVYLAVARTRSPGEGEASRVLAAPGPDHHRIRCANLVNEFFENAPSDWSWLDGSFRMDCRWACEDQWNFLACGSVQLPCLVSKRTFTGDQIHEYFICLRSVFPWDAGDSSFTYDPEADRANRHRLLQARNGWYNRRDLNFSFCTDGRNPLSGYTVVFAGDDNTATRLLRKGETVAHTREPRFLLPRDPSHLAVHWDWWRFTVRKLGARVRVSLNDVPMFDYVDPTPIPGGHIGVWSIRNGFALARATSVAQDIGWEPDVLYVPDGPLENEGWGPLYRDSTLLAHDSRSGMTRITARAGGGFLAVRYAFTEPVDLRETPVLELPLTVGPDAVVSLHLEIGGRSYLVQVDDSPIGEVKALLTPAYERGECFQLPTMPLGHVQRYHLLASVRTEGGTIRLNLPEALRGVSPGRPLPTPLLTMLTVGNTSNEGYLLAGAGANAAGSSYLVGRPRFHAE